MAASLSYSPTLSVLICREYVIERLGDERPVPIVQGAARA
jgi:hypothetical protein